MGTVGGAGGGGAPPVIQSLLIANRGEIARRIMRTARAMGIRTIAVHSDVDSDMPFVREADEAVCIGPAPARESYLDQAKILAAAKQTGAEAIHPGYGFLSENAEFAEAVADAGLIWVGAPPAAIRAMGLKDAAKALMEKAGVPVTPGYLGEDQSPERLQQEAGRIGYPVLIKAVAGGGGKGMRRVDQTSDFADALASCRREAASSFGDDRVLIEKYILNPRHIEVQVFGDTHGNVVHLFERDCSLQRRHQKVIEEAPAPGMDAKTREAICTAAVKAAKAVDYVGAGTIEFIADASDGLRADRVWFMEMNTRLQVEHPVTEEITGQDLVEWQLRVASGEPLPKPQNEIRIDGWAMEARLYAEDPTKGFLPSVGRLNHLSLPFSSARVESGVEQGNRISPYYDPMIAKVIVHGEDREVAAALLSAAMEEIEVYPVRTNAAFLARIAKEASFISAQVDTGFIERHLDRLAASPSDVAAIGAALGWRLEEFMSADQPFPKAISPWDSAPSRLFGFRLNADAIPASLPFRMDDEAHFANIRPAPMGTGANDWTWDIALDGAPFAGAEPMPTTYGDNPGGDGSVYVFSEGHCFRFTFGHAQAGGSQSSSDGTITSPMPGRIVSVDVAEGTPVKAGQKLVVIEAMKMEQGLLAPFDGVVAELKAVAGAQVSEGTLLIRIEKQDK
jgi:propionyl-CoA carboxylase alpha chain/3-methylcrotonyl-CoA carboxylase alpha subunit